MGQGLRLFNENGVLTLDTNAQLCRIIGSATSQFSWPYSGRIEVPEFAHGVPWAIGTVDYTNVLADTSIAGSNYNYDQVVRFKIVGNGLDWNWSTSSRQGKHFASTVFWGVTY